VSRLLIRWLAGALIAGCALAIAGPASARGLKQQFFRVELRTGKVEAMSEGPAEPVVQWPSPDSDARRSITNNERTLLVYDEAPGDPASRHVTWQFTLPGSGPGWMPWRVLQGDTVICAWSEPVPDQRDQHRQIVRAVDIPRRKVLWERVVSAQDPAGAAIGAHHLAVDQPKEILVLETRTGRLVRRLAKTEPSFAVTRAAPGQVWVETGGVLEALDEATASTLWRTAKQGELQWLVPIPGSGDWLMKTAGHAYRVRAADGHAAWSAPSAASSRPLVHDGRIYEGTLVVESSHRRARMVVIERDLQSGKQVREYPVGSHAGFFDQADVAAVEAKDGWIDVATHFTVLD
jgi:hypothetical protein